jgi:hypothetical protein
LLSESGLVRSREPVVLRSFLASLSVGSYGVLVLGTALALLFPVLPHSLVYGGIVGSAFLSFGYSARISLALKPDRIVIRNAFSTHSFRWDEVQAIVLTRATYPGFPSRPRCVGFVLHDVGKRLPALATVSWGWRFGRPSRNSRRIVELIDGLAESHGIRNEVTAEALAGVRKFHVDSRRA